MVYFVTTELVNSTAGRNEARKKLTVYLNGGLCCTSPFSLSHNFSFKRSTQSNPFLMIKMFRFISRTGVEGLSCF